MSLIRKPPAAEQESSLRRAAEATLAHGRAVRDVGQEVGSGTRRLVSKVAQMWLLVGFTFGALMASSVGAKLLGLTIMAPFWYFVLRRRERPVPGGGSQAKFNGSADFAAPAGFRKAGGSMQSFYYRRGKNMAGALMLAALALLTGKWGLSPGHHTSLIFAAVCALGAVACAMHAMNGGPALAYDRSGITMRSMFGGLEQVPWHSVQSIDIKVLTLRYLGIIPISRNEILNVRCDGGMFGTRKLRIAPKALQLPPGGSIQLLAMLRQAQLDAVGVAGVAMAGAGPTGWGAADTKSPNGGDSGFDPDAAIARYLAKRDAEHSPPAALKDIAPAQYQRPQFGRRRA